MNLLLQRRPSGLTCTIGDLYIDGKWQCYVLEDLVRELEGQPVREWKIAGATAIPAGHYRLMLTHSPRFGRVLPLLVEVPGFVGVRIHAGNTDSDTEGCLLPGDVLAGDSESVLKSGRAFDALFQRLLAAEAMEHEPWIEIRNAPS